MRPAAIVAAGVVLVLSVACSSRSSPNSAAGLKAAASKLAHAQLVGDGKTYYPFLNSTCRKTISEAGLIKAWRPLTRGHTPDYQVSVSNFHVGRGEVQIRVAAFGHQPPMTGNATFAFTDGNWRLSGNGCIIGFFGASG